MNRKRVVLLITVLVFVTTSFAYASEQAISKDYTFNADDPYAENFDAKKEIEEQGKKYVLKGVSYKVVQETETYISRKVTFKGLDRKEVPPQKKFCIDGKSVVLKANENVQYSETIETVTEKLFGYVTMPIFPQGKQIKNGGKTFKGTLIGTVEEKVEKPYTATVKFIGIKGADYYFNGHKITLIGSGPAWKGDKQTVLDYLNLPHESTLSSRIWTSDFKKENGQTVRYAQFSGMRPASNYILTYSYKKYDATAVYDNGKEPGAKEYTIKASCTYEAVGMSPLKKVLLAAAGICILALLVAAILMILRRRRREAGRY